MYEFCVVQLSGLMSVLEIRRLMMDFLDIVMLDIYSYSEGGQYSYVMLLNSDIYFVVMVN